MRIAIAALALLATAACSTGATPFGGPPPAANDPPQNAEEATQADTCGMAAYQRFIGRPVSEIDRATLRAGTRVITPEMAVTMDFRAERLNIMVGTDGRVGSLRCF